MTPTSRETIIIGGGVTGLYAALKALDEGHSDIHVYEASTRLGGKIKSLPMNGENFNMGAEFIDIAHSKMIGLCTRFGLQLVPCVDQKQHAIQGLDGKIYENFFAEYAPVAQRIIRDREKIATNPGGAFTQHINTLSTAQYLGELRRDPDLKNVPPDIFEVAANAFTAEVGQMPENSTARQFIAETTPGTDRFLMSDGAYRVEGGTEAIIHHLRRYLEEHGVSFHFAHRLEFINKKESGVTDLTFHSPHGAEHAQSKNIFISLPTYALSRVKGMASLGMTAEDEALLEHLQHARLVKFTASLKPGQNVPCQNLFSLDAQTFPVTPGHLTFVCHHRNEQKPPELIRHNLELYARSLGKPVDEVFDMGPGKIAFENPAESPCFSTPSPKHHRVIDRLLSKLTDLDRHGVHMVGTYFPLHGAVGFMECGLASVENALERTRTHAKGASPPAGVQAWTAAVPRHNISLPATVRTAFTERGNLPPQAPRAPGM